MTKIKGKISDIKKLLQLIKLEGKDTTGSSNSMIENCLLEAKEGKISTNILSKTNVVIGFINYKALDIITEGEIPIGNIDEVLSYLKRFDDNDEITLETTENKIKLSRESPKKTASIPMSARENIDDSLRAEAIKDSITEENGKYKFRDTELIASMKVDSHIIKQVLDDGDVQGLDRKYPISIDEEIECKVGDEAGGIIETTISAIEKSGKAKSSFSGGIDNVFNNLSGEVEIHIAENGPMLVIKNDEDLEIKFVVAPLIEE